MGKLQVRVRKDPSPVKKVSEVEAAYVVQSYLTEKQFATTLAGFRVDAASILNSLKNAPPAVRSLTTILNDFVTLREKQRILEEENARLEQCLREAQQVLQQERSRMNSLVQGVHESLAVFQSGCPSPSTSALPSMSSSPTTSVAVFQVGLKTPPHGAGLELTKTPPYSLRATNSGYASTKRKNGLSKTPQEAAHHGSPTTTRVVSAKKARQSGQVTDSLSGAPPSSPWMPGMVRKTSLNTVRTVVPMPCQELHFPSSAGSKTPQPGRPRKTQFTSPPVASTKEPQTNTPAPLSTDFDRQNINSSALPLLTRGETSIECCDDQGQSSGQDPQTPPRNSSSSTIIPPEQVPVPSQPLDAKSCTPPPHSTPVNQSPQQPYDGRNGKELALHSDSSSEYTPGSCPADRTREEFHFGKVLSKTMRPLDFSDSAIVHRVGSAGASQTTASTKSPPPSQCEGASAGAQSGDDSEHSAADFSLIDDILASLDEESFSSLVGEMLGTDEITMNELVSHSLTDGDVDFSNIQSVTNRSSIGEDSFGFQCHPEASICENILEPSADGPFLEHDGNATSGDVPSKIVSDSHYSSPRPDCDVLSERDPNRSFSEHIPQKSSPSFRLPSKRETKAKYAFGKENATDPGIVDIVEGVNNLSSCIQ